MYRFHYWRFHTQLHAVHHKHQFLSIFTVYRQISIHCCRLWYKTKQSNGIICQCICVICQNSTSMHIKIDSIPFVSNGRNNFMAYVMETMHMCVLHMFVWELNINVSHQAKIIIKCCTHNLEERRNKTTTQEK